MTQSAGTGKLGVKQEEMTLAHAEAVRNIKNAVGNNILVDTSGDIFMKNDAVGNIDMTPLQLDDIINGSEEALSDIKAVEARLEQYKPEGSLLNIYMDFDNYFIILYPVLNIGQEKYMLNDSHGVDNTYNADLEIFMYSLHIFLNKFKMYQSRHFPPLMTLPVIYTEDILDFLLKAVPCLLKISDIYYTSRFKRIMVKKTLKVCFSSVSGSIKRYLECGFTYDSDISPEELEAIMNAFNAKEETRFYQLKKGGFIDLRAEKVSETLEFLTKFGITRKDLENRKIIIPKCDAPYISNLLKKAEIKKTVEFTGIDINSIEKRFFRIADAKFEIPKSLRAEMRPYQREGYRWLKTLFYMGLGGILADDMGLGKTLQAIALILSEHEEKSNMKSLIIVPTSLIDNWISELNRFAPELKCVAVAGDTSARNKIFEQWDEYSVFITSYGLVLNDITEYEKKTFDILVLDEAQKIKNRQSKTVMTIKNIKAGNKLALTGTPIENNLAELWSIFNWLMPSLLKEFESFKAKYMDTSANMDELRERIKPFVLRRMKKDVLDDLPEKTETTINIELTEMQKKLYLAYREEVIKLLEEERQIINVLSKLTRLRQICCHPRMFLDDYRESTGKLDILIDIATELKEEGRKVLIFSQFTSMLDIIKDALCQNNIEYKILDGRTPQKDRSVIISDFEEGPATVFLISLKAGGTGLNLTSADTVIHCDPWWNPSAEEQASARAYRIGQKNCVQIIYLIAVGTIEEKINEVKLQKKELIETLIKPGGKKITSLSINELKEILN